MDAARQERRKAKAKGKRAHRMRIVLSPLDLSLLSTLSALHSFFPLFPSLSLSCSVCLYCCFGATFVALAH